MNFDLSAEQRMLTDQARELLSSLCTYDHLRSLIDANAEWDEPLWRQLAEVGFLGANLPEEYGGVGLTALDLGVINQELGRANAAVPFYSSIVLAAGVIALAGSDSQKKAWLPRLASGTTIGCFAFAEGAGWRKPTVRYTDGRLTGTKTPVADAGIAQMAVVQCAEGLALVDLNQPSVSRTRLESFDQLRPHYRLEFRNAGAELLPGPATAEQIFDHAAVQASFEAIGGAEACLYMARDYAGQRNIFGRTLASYQAIKHRLADVITAIELARSNAFFAGWAATHAPAELPAAAAASRLTAIAAFEIAARENLHIHGGLGYTFAGNCHFYYRRERTLAVTLGGRERWAERLLVSLPSSPTQAA